MDKSFISHTVMCGKSRRKLTELNLSIGVVEPVSAHLWGCKVECSGYIVAKHDSEATSAFDCLIDGLAFLRQTLRIELRKDEKLKFYINIEDEIVERSIEDIFWTHDCVSDEMQEMIDWAGENGFQPE